MLQTPGFAKSAFGRTPTFLGATVASQEFSCTGVVYKVTQAQFDKQVGDISCVAGACGFHSPKQGSITRANCVAIEGLRAMQLLYIQCTAN
jgi:hypothetical protein